ncbi:hypothetical protein KIN20_021578 [Parelaphostrongylus tenuis]|uniref:Uncharacterized protein n=2 Tax=Parelaphostrongylus tenuis TaxID=148309 RepID=A0AAD5MP37_PARTN|nr:hypothetical protein KIN20_021578 [Parelaphostrongylus tenuis]
MTTSSAIGPLIITAIIIATVLGCGVMPPSQERTRSFTVSGFNLPVSMVYTREVTIRAEAPGMAPTKEAAKAFIERLVMQTVFDVLEEQGRSALLPDAVISNILSQLRIQINYDPLECKGATVSKGPQTQIMGNKDKLPHCIVVGSTVTSTCPLEPPDTVMCMTIGMPMKVESISANLTTISGTLTTTNIIMANWSRQMWQSTVSRAVRMLASGPFRSNFFAASVTVS